MSIEISSDTIGNRTRVLLAQCLKQLRHCMPQKVLYAINALQSTRCYLIKSYDRLWNYMCILCCLLNTTGMSPLKMRDMCTSASVLSLTGSEARLHSTTAEYSRMFYSSQPQSSMICCEASSHFGRRNAYSSPWQLVWSNTRGSCVTLLAQIAVACPPCSYRRQFMLAPTHNMTQSAFTYFLTHRSTVYVRYPSTVKIPSLGIRSTGSVTWLTQFGLNL